MNHLLDFIKSNKDWKETLSNPPYNLIIKEDSDFPNLYLFKYNQYDSDMSNMICQEARGIIIEITDNITRIVCHSFDKFFNFSEPNATPVLARFNWDHYTFQEKRDGSLMRLWFYNGRWNISTSGTIDAYKAEMQIPSNPYNSFGDMFNNIFKSYNENLNALNPGYTYSFEMTSPHNKIVVDYDKDELTLIGVRDICDNIELDPVIFNPFESIKVPDRWHYETIDEALKIINEKHNFEGLVLCDDNFNRVKIKTEEYLVLARITDETSSDRGILRLILEDKIDDVQNMLPHIQERINKVKDFIKNEIGAVNDLYQQIDWNAERKEIALQLKGNSYSSFVFKRLGNPDYNFVDDYFKIENLEKIYRSYKEKIGVKDDGAQE